LSSGGGFAPASAAGQSISRKPPFVYYDQKCVASTRRALIDQYMSRNPPPQLLPGLLAAVYYSGEILAQPMRCEILYYQRQRYIREFGFCLFTSECIAAIATLCKGKQVMEAGSGSGWLASRLALYGISITAADWADYRLPPDENRGYPMQTVFRLDYHGDALALLPGAFDVVLLVWPNHNTPFAEQVARAMKPGQMLILCSEEKGGRMATNTFFEILGADFELLGQATRSLNEHHRTFPGLYDRWTVLRKI
jgi:2-polyprenyl-3-methyl-5-hydroxy-6-metoxy-1,4-benzoquinol methylase